MRLWKLDELTKRHPNDHVIHVCELCNYRTPLLVSLDYYQVKEIPDFVNIKEIKENICDKCNSKVFAVIQDYGRRIEESYGEFRDE